MTPAARIRGGGTDRAAGQSTIEFALVLPVLVLLLAAMVDVGVGIFSYNSVTNASREGARLAIVNQDETSVRQRAIGQTAVAETAAPNVTVGYFLPEPNDDPRSNPTCAAPVKVGCIAVVTFQTTYRPLTPIIGSLIGSGGITMTATTMLPVEYTCPSARVPLAANCAKQP